MIAAAAAVGVPAVRALRGAGVRRWVKPATPGTLGVIRAWVAAVLFASVWWEDLASSAYLPREMLVPGRQPLVDLVHAAGLGGAMASPTAMQLFEWTAGLLLLLAMAGFKTRWTVPAAAVAYLFFGSILRSYAWFYHTGLVPLYALIFLCSTPCGDGFSVDRWLRRRRGEPVAPADAPRLRYGAGRFLVWMAVAVPYTLAGLSKVRDGGPLWWTGDHMKTMLVGTSLDPMEFDFGLTFTLLRGTDWIFDVLGIAALAGEISFVVVLVSVVARRILPLVMAGMHVGILLMQNILFPDLIALQAVFYDRTPVRRWISARLGVAARAVRTGPVLAPARGGTPRQIAVARVFLAVGLVIWITRTDKYPLTAMQMFSRHHPAKPAQYVRATVVYEDGTRERARFERWIGAVADSRYRWLLRDWERDPERLPLLRSFLDACAARANADAPSGRRIRRFELERREWDFRANPTDPARGQVREVIRHDV